MFNAAQLFAYCAAGVWVAIMVVLLDTPGYRWAESKTSEGATVALILMGVLWPLTIVIHAGLLLWWLLGWPSRRVPGALWRGLRFLGRGVRDLLPKRKPKVTLPTARAVKE